MRALLAGLTIPALSQNVLVNQDSERYQGTVPNTNAKVVIVLIITHLN